jgi:DUF1365 family protein
MGDSDKGPLASALYFGTVRHRRFGPRENHFRYSLYMAYLDLGELDRVFADSWAWRVERPGLASFRRADHDGDPALSLDEHIRRLVAGQTGARPTGPIRLLTHLRYFGYCFNPVSFYYCFDPAGERVETIVAEVTNTPWHQTHNYVLAPTGDEGANGHHVWRFPKAFHVSPFMGMDMDYEWQFTDPGRRLGVHMVNHRGGEILFDATLTLERRPIDAANRRRALMQFPLMTGKVVAAIYWQALKLWWKGVPFHPHPDPAARR